MEDEYDVRNRFDQGCKIALPKSPPIFWWDENPVGYFASLVLTAEGIILSISNIAQF